MARVDWDLMQRLFEQAREENPNLSRDDFCEQKGLNPNSARRYIKVRKSSTDDGKKSPSQSGQSSAQKTARSSANSSSKSSRKTAQTAQKDNSRTAQTAQKSKRRRRRATPDVVEDAVDMDLSGEGESPKRAPLRTPAQEKPRPPVKNRRAATQGAGRGSRERHPDFEQGNALAFKHGGYASWPNLDEDIRELVESMPQCVAIPEIQLLRGQLLQMERSQKEWIEAEYEAEEKRSQVLEGTLVDVDPAAVPVETDTEATPVEVRIAHVLFSTSERIEKLAGRVGTLIKDGLETARKERLMSGLSQADKEEIRIEVMEQYRAKKWTATRACEEMELRGVEPPGILLEKAKVELTWMEPPQDPNEGGITDDELEALSQEYNAQLEHERGEWLAQRQEEARKLIDQMAEEEYLVPDDPDQDLEDEDWDGAEVVSG